MASAFFVLGFAPAYAGQGDSDASVETTEVSADQEMTSSDDLTSGDEPATDDSTANRHDGSADQTGSDADQTGSDADQTGSDAASGDVAQDSLTVASPDGGANGDCGAYCPKLGGPSLNGSEDNNSSKPDAGMVGNADDKYPPGQAPDGTDSNNGYECDGNQGIGQGNPAHTRNCQEQLEPPAPPEGEPEPPTVVDHPPARPPAVIAPQPGQQVAPAQPAPAAAMPAGGGLPATGAAENLAAMSVAGGLMVATGIGTLLLRRRLRHTV